jgi:CBS domain-containing protein
MSVSRICIHEVDLARPTETVQVAAHRMHDRKVGTLVVLDDDRKPIGILTDRDIAIRVVAFARHPSTTTVFDVMTTRLFTVDEGAAIEKALSLMRTHQVRRLLVVDLEGRLSGLLTLDDILEFLAREFRMISQLLDREGPHSLAKPV